MIQAIMCPHTEAQYVANLSAAMVAQKAERIALQLWSTSDGLDVVRVSRTADGFGEVEQLGTLYLCDRAKALTRGM